MLALSVLGWTPTLCKLLSVSHDVIPTFGKQVESKKDGTLRFSSALWQVLGQFLVPQRERSAACPVPTDPGLSHTAFLPLTRLGVCPISACVWKVAEGG